MEQTEKYYDFCVPYNTDAKEMNATLDELVYLGYKTIAIEQIFDHSKKDVSKKDAADSNNKDIFPEPIDIKALQATYEKNLKILQRLTIIYADVNISHAWMNSLNLKKYHILAGQPKCDAALTHCCNSFNGDIITFDTNAGMKLLIHRKSYQIAIGRGLYFEIKYAPAISDPNNRKDMIKVAFNYNIRGKSKNIIFSSGAQNNFELRGPYDVANLAYIFSLTVDQGKNAIDRNCRQLFLKAVSRRLGKTLMMVKQRNALIDVDDSNTDSDSDNDSDDENDHEDSDLKSVSNVEDTDEETDNEDENKVEDDSEDVADKDEIVSEATQFDAKKFGKSHKTKATSTEQHQHPKKKQKMI